MAKVALITGATRGIGKAIAIRLANAGFDIALNYRKENDDLTNTKSEIEKAGVDCLPVQGDISSFEDCERIAKEIFDKFGKIDVLVNNAGITKDMLLMRMKPEDFSSVVDVNLIGTFNMTRNVVPYMVKARSGRVVNISSVVGIEGNAGQTNYSASKAGLIALAKSIAQEMGPRGIRANAIAPGFIETAMTAALPEEVRKDWMTKIPARRGGQVEDIANVATFLASDMSSYVTGQVIQVDGGMNM